MKAKQIINLADELIKNIKSKNDCFETTTIVFPNSIVEQWFKAHWLKTQGDSVLMNVEFKKLNEALSQLVEQPKYKLINQSTLKQVILSILLNDTDDVIPEEYETYYGNDPVKISDFASSLSSLYLNYYKDNYEGIDDWESTWQFNLYKKIVDVCKNHNFGTIEKPIPRKTNDKMYFFGFSKLDKVYRYLLDSCNYVEEYSLEIDEDYKTEYTIKCAPSKLREIEMIHTDICNHLLNGASVSDFLIVAPNISEYANDIQRVFRQNDKEYPSIPYVIRQRGKIETNVTSILETLFRIFKNKFYTRLDFYKIVSNPMVQLVRNINNDEVDNWMRTIANLNIYRNHPFLDDWTYLKKRLLLSKLSSINFEDNLVSLKDKDYLPYTNISFDDNSIVNITNVINDLDSFIKTLNSKKVVDSDFIDLVKCELDKWMSLIEGEVETNKYYKKVLSSIYSLKEIGCDKLPVDTFFYMLIDDSYVSSSQIGSAFINGVTFTDFDVNTITTEKYIYFIGASSKNIPITKVKSELDLRKETEGNDDSLTFQLIYQNSLEMFNVSFIYIDLKTEEKFYLSPFITDFNKKNNVYADEKYYGFPLDENREYNELFTRREFTNKVYFYQLLNENNDSTTTVETASEPVFYETISAKDMAKFLVEPLMTKASRLFNYDDDIQEKIKDEWEPFNPSAMIRSIVENKIIYDMVTGTFDYERLKNNFELGNQIPTINQEYEDRIFDSYEEDAKNVLDTINDVARNGYGILEPTSIKLYNDEGREWMLTSNKPVGISTDGNERMYIELKDMSKTQDISKFMDLYIISLMDVSKLEENTYHIFLVKGEEEKKKKEKYSPKTQWTFDITPSIAIKFLNNIHNAIGNFNHNCLTPIDFLKLKPESVNKYYLFIKKVLESHGPWEYFAHKSLFDPYDDWGYNYFSYSKLKQELNIQELYIEFLNQFEEDSTDE